MKLLTENDSLNRAHINDCNTLDTITTPSSLTCSCTKTKTDTDRIYLLGHNLATFWMKQWTEEGLPTVQRELEVSKI